MQVQKSHGVSLIYLMKGVLSMNKNEQTATMYESIPAVAELNKVPGFNPLKLLRRIISPENGEEMLQLDLRYKKLWFRLANPKGRIRLNALRITEQMAIYEAQVFLERTDENPIGSFTSSCTKEEAPGGQYIQAAQHAAMDEALSDAGFGIQFADVGMDAKGSHYGSRVPFNGISQKKETTALAGTAAVSTEGKQPDTAPARSTVTAFPAAAEKKETPQQEKPAQTSGLPIQGAKVAVNTGPAGNSPAQRTDAETKVPLETMTGNGKPAASLPAGSQGGTESLPAGPEESFGTLPVQSGTTQKMEGQSLPSAQEPSGQPSAGSAQTVGAGGESKTEPSARTQEPAENSSLPVGPQTTKVQETAGKGRGTGFPSRTEKRRDACGGRNGGQPPCFRKEEYGGRYRESSTGHDGTVRRAECFCRSSRIFRWKCRKCRKCGSRFTGIRSPGAACFQGNGTGKSRGQVYAGYACGGDRQADDL